MCNILITMKRKLFYAIGIFIGLLVLLIVSSLCVKFDFTQMCVTTSKDNSYMIAVNEQIHNYVNHHHIEKIKSNEENRTNYFYLYYQSKTNDTYLYWLNPTSASFSLDEGTYNLVFDFGKINFISYVLKI